MTSVCIQVSHGAERRVLLKNQQLFMLVIISLIFTSLMLYSTVILCTSIAQGHRSKSHTSLNFFRPYFHYCSSSVHYCEDRLHIQFFICSSLFFSYIYCQCFSDEKLDTPCFILITQGIPSTYNKDLQVRFMAEKCRKICNPFTTLFSIKTCDLRSSGN